MPSEEAPAASEAVDAADATDADGSETPSAAAASGTSSDAAAAPAARDPIEWGPVRHERLRSLAVGVGLVVLLALLSAVAVVAVGLAGSAWEAIAGSGSLAALVPGDAWVFLLLVLVGGPFSVIYLLVAYDRSTPETRDRIRAALGGYSLSLESLRPAWVVVGAAPLVALLVWGPSWLTAGAWALFPLIWLVPMIAGSQGTSIRLDPADRVVERTDHTRDRTSADDLDALVRTRRIDLPWTTVFVLAYRGTDWYRSTPWLFVPADRADAVEAALDGVLARSEGPDRASVPERVVLALLGSGSLVVGAAMTAVGADGGVVLGLLTAPFSLVFLALAARL